MQTRNLAGLLLAFTIAACAETADEEQPAADTTAMAAPAPAPEAAAPTSGMLDPNAATAEQLAAIPGMNATLASAVVNGRPYDDMRAVDKALTGLTDEQRDTVYNHLWKPLDLNSASKEEIELIPGVGPRMSREFLEYRPYANIEEFRQEIGKYVDATEIARLEKFVTIRAAGQ